MPSPLLTPRALPQPISRGLLIVPLVTTTYTLAIAASETATFSSLLACPPNLAGNALLSPFWDTFLYAEGGPLIAVALTTSATAATLWRKLAAVGAAGGVSGGVEWQRKLAGWTAVAAAAHFAFAYPIAKIIGRVVIDKDVPKQDSRQDVKNWLKVHAVRTLVTDIPAFLCALGVVYYAI